MFKNLFLAIFISMGLCLGCVTAVKKCEIKSIDIVDKVQPSAPQEQVDKANAYVHGWNMMAYAEGSNLSFYNKTNSAGDKVFVAVNVDVDFSISKEVELYKVLLSRISAEWYSVSGSRLVNIFSSDGILTMWTDKSGRFHSIIQRGKNV